MRLELLWHAALLGLITTVALAVLTWLISLIRRDVSIVDSLWSVFIVAAGGTYALQQTTLSLRALFTLMIASLWALRLAVYIPWRNHGQSEDRRYRQIRARNEPHFAIKSLYLVFGLQALLAWIVSAPLLAVQLSSSALTILDELGVVVALGGLAVEAIGDMQMAAFKAAATNQGKVMDSGLWRYTRHPNYFGECCVWWGLFLIALSAGGWWSVISPLLMTWLLLKVSGVSLLESDIAERRPAYRDYIARTNGFIPGKPKRSGAM